MKATTLLLAQHRRIQELIVAARAVEKRDERVGDLIEGIVMHIATEEGVVYPEVERALGIDTRPHRASHVRTRLALFRFVTAPLRKGTYELDLASLEHAVREHALAESSVIRMMEDQIGEGGLARLGDKMQAFQRELRARAPLRARDRGAEQGLEALAS